MQVALYTRVSTERQHQAQTIEQQVAQLQTWVAATMAGRSATSASSPGDGHSGVRLNRPDLDALRDQAARAAF